MVRPLKLVFDEREVIEKVRRSIVVPYFLGGVDVVHVDDAVDGIGSTLRQGRNGERYILGGENVPFRRIVEMSAECLGLRRILVSIPYLVSGLGTMTLEPIGKLTGRRPRLTYDEHHYVNRFHFYDSGKAKKDLGYNPRSFKTIVEDYLGNRYA